MLQLQNTGPPICHMFGANKLMHFLYQILKITRSITFSFILCWESGSDQIRNFFLDPESLSVSDPDHWLPYTLVHRMHYLGVAVGVGVGGAALLAIIVVLVVYLCVRHRSRRQVNASVVDPDPYWIRIQEPPGSGSTHVNIGQN